MKKMFLTLSMLLIAAASFANPVEISVTESGEKLEAVMVEIECKKYYTDLNGILNVDLEPGVYTLKISKISYEDRYVVVNITEKSSKLSIEFDQNS